MQSLTFLNTREIKQLREPIIEQFGYFPEGNYAFLRSENDRIFIVSKDIARLNLQHLIIERIGLYFAESRKSEAHKQPQVRLSKEGAQFLAREAQKKKIKLTNVVTLSAEEVKNYFLGIDVDKDLGEKVRPILLQYNQEILGCAKYKEGKILNFLPKYHRGEVIV